MTTLKDALDVVELLADEEVLVNAPPLTVSEAQAAWDIHIISRSLFRQTKGD